LPSLSIRFSHHPAEVRHIRVTPVGSLFLLLRRSTNSASHAKHYCSDGEPILVGAPSTIAWRAKHYYSVAPSPLHLQPHRKRCHGQSKGAQWP